MKQAIRLLSHHLVAEEGKEEPYCGNSPSLWSPERSCHSWPIFQSQHERCKARTLQPQLSISKLCSAVDVESRARDGATKCQTPNMFAWYWADEPNHFVVSNPCRSLGWLCSSFLVLDWVEIPRNFNC